MLPGWDYGEWGHFHDFAEQEGIDGKGLVDASWGMRGVVSDLRERCGLRINQMGAP
jgi:hypothetical protein